MKWPTIKEIARALRNLNANVEGETDVRLCVWSDGEWCLRWGPVDYDPSFSDFCGASSVPGVVDGKVRRFDSQYIARDLLEQCKEQHACGEG